MKVELFFRIVLPRFKNNGNRINLNISNFFLTIVRLSYILLGQPEHFDFSFGKTLDVSNYIIQRKFASITLATVRPRFSCFITPGTFEMKRYIYIYIT